MKKSKRKKTTRQKQARNWTKKIQIKVNNEAKEKHAS